MRRRARGAALCIPCWIAAAPLLAAPRTVAAALIVVIGTCSWVRAWARPSATAQRAATPPSSQLPANRPTAGARSNAPPVLPTPVAISASPANSHSGRGAVRSAPLLGGGVSELRLNPHIPYWRLGLAGICAAMAIGQRGTSEKAGWATLGGGLLSWALIDWFVPALRSKASD